MTTQPVDAPLQGDGLDDDLDDLAAELDDEEHDPAPDDESAEPREHAHFQIGYCQGGPPPYPGKLLVSRYAGGVLLVDKVAARAWVFDFDAAGGLYRCRDEAGAPVDEAGRWRASEGDTYEVRAYDGEFAGDEPPNPGEQCDLPGCDDDAGGGA